MKVYISYRRHDTAPYAGRLADRLIGRFGDRAVLVDFETFSPGVDQMSVLRNEITHSDVVLALIGKQWASAKDSAGRLRFDNPNDFVRLELETAFESNVPVIPVLVADARMPAAEDMPLSLRQIVSRTAAFIRHERFHADADRLIQGMQTLLREWPKAVMTKPTTPGLDKQSERPKPDVEFAEPSMPRVFVSHANDDLPWVERHVIGPLQENGLELWYSRTSIESAADWEREILRGMESCGWFLLVISPRSQGSEWVKDELHWAVNHRPRRIVPVIMEGADLYQFHMRLPRLQYVDMSKDTKSTVTRLLLLFTAAN